MQFIQSLVEYHFQSYYNYFTFSLTVTIELATLHAVVLTSRLFFFGIRPSFAALNQYSKAAVTTSRLY